MKISKSLFIIFLTITSIIYSQKPISKRQDVYIDSSGVMRWKNSSLLPNQKDEEVNLFGVNYTTPFAYSYRAHKRLGISLKIAIDMDVAQMARLGFDAFRVHMWDREISDKDGNVLVNEHLDLFDYLLKKLEDNGIKIIITPIAWWATGWPEPDEKTAGFSQNYNRGELITNQNARAAERNYLKQIINHVNSYTKLSYKDDHSIIAVEIINEPNHPQKGQETTDYINEMAKVLRDAGYVKPLFYNISENCNNVQAQAVCNANIDGISFQWYPTGLVHNKMLSGNYLINVNRYLIPSDSIKGFNKKAKMVYEFDAADIGASYMYPAIVRSYREAGMQFATMFSYDPVHIAWSNTEYPTHFLNLLYSPSKAIGLMIAGKAFHLLPRMKSYGDYPLNNRFGDFRVSYDEDLSELNSDTAFYYTNNTKSNPKNIVSLKHIAGIGNSPVVNYDGTGAYFLDKLDKNIWRLEVYPDVLWIKDPFEQTSMSRQVSKLYRNTRKMKLSIPELINKFEITSLSADAKLVKEISRQEFSIRPGAYLLTSDKADENKVQKILSTREERIDGFYVPSNLASTVDVVNCTSSSAVISAPMDFKFKIAGTEKISGASMFIKRLAWRGFKKYPLKSIGGFDYVIDDTSKFTTAGILEYCVAVETTNGVTTFPGGIKISPDNWDFSSDKLWCIDVKDQGESICLFDAYRDRKDIVFSQYNQAWRYTADYTDGSDYGKSSLSMKLSFLQETKYPFGIQLNVSDLLKPFAGNMESYKYLVIKARSTTNNDCTIGINLLLNDGKSLTAKTSLKNNWEKIKIPLTEFQPGEVLILPESYPRFLPKTWKGVGTTTDSKIDLSALQFFQITCENRKSGNEDVKRDIGFDVESVYLSK